MGRALIRRRQVDRIEAMGRLEGRLLLDIEEQLGPCLKWPARFTELVLCSHLRFTERYQLTLLQARLRSSNCSRSRFVCASSHRRFVPRGVG